MHRAAVAALLLFACALHAQSTGRRRAVVIGINDYSASRLGRSAAPGRDWPDLSGAATDAAGMREMLMLLYGFDARDIVTLTDQAATRNAILQSLKTISDGAQKDDVVFLYFAGHGSQVRNSKSDEPDKLDESLVPADSRAGARDIRDKELRPLLNRMLDRGARVTVMLDNCHSGSGARGLPVGAHPRGIKADPRDVADGNDYGPRPDKRGALLISAAQDYDQAWETRGSDGQIHGAFTWAWMRALRDAAAGEPAMDTFLRAQARLRSEKPFQLPAIEGREEAKLVPFLGVRRDRQGDRAIIAVESVRPDGTVLLQGGWANGLAPGTQLRIASDDARLTARLTVISVTGLGRSEARGEPGRALPQAVHSGALLEVVGWAIPPAGPLRVWAPRYAGSASELAVLAKRFASAATRRGLRWISDPTDITPAYVLRRGARGWELVVRGSSVELAGGDADAVAAILKIAPGDSLFVQLPAPVATLAAIGLDDDGIRTVQSAADADYVLAGRWSTRKLEYSWIRPGVKHDDRRKSGLPLRTKWIDGVARGTATALRDSMLRLRRIRAWQTLESPPESRSAYRLALLRDRTRELAGESALVGEESYHLVLRLGTPALAPRVQQRFMYVFVIDSEGRSTLLFPTTGSVENRLPVALPPPPSLEVGEPFDVTTPYGIDTYFLLTTDEPLADPYILEWDAVRAGAAPETPLEELLILTAGGARGRTITVPTAWSLEKIVFESVSPRGR